VTTGFTFEVCLNDGVPAVPQLWQHVAEWQHMKASPGMAEILDAIRAEGIITITELMAGAWRTGSF